MTNRPISLKAAISTKDRAIITFSLNNGWGVTTIEGAEASDIHWGETLPIAWQRRFGEKIILNPGDELIAVRALEQRTKDFAGTSDEDDLKEYRNRGFIRLVGDDCWYVCEWWPLQPVSPWLRGNLIKDGMHHFWLDDKKKEEAGK